MRSALLVLTMLVGCGAATPAPVSGAIPELDYFVGRWHAEAENPADHTRFELEYRVAPVLGGRWYRGTGRVASLDLEIHDLWGKDPATGEIIRVVFDSAGVMGTVRSPGWDGDRLILEGEAVSAGGRVAIRETITRVDDDHFGAVWEAQRDGTWSAYSVETLRRIGR